MPDHDLLAAMAALWLALPAEAQRAMLEELAPRVARPKGKREEEGHTEPSSCTRDSEWELEEAHVDSAGSKKPRIENDP